jgi:hypothetical protein
VLQVLGAVACLLLIAVPVSSDDTDIYLNAGLGGGVSGTPLVMMNLDLRSNLGSTECSNAIAGCSGGACSCEANLSSEVFAALDLVDVDGNLGADGVPDAKQHTAADLGVDGLAGGADYWDGVTVTMFDGMRAVFQILFRELADIRVRAARMPVRPRFPVAAPPVAVTAPMF